MCRHSSLVTVIFLWRHTHLSGHKLGKESDGLNTSGATDTLSNTIQRWIFISCSQIWQTRLEWMNQCLARGQHQYSCWKHGCWRKWTVLSSWIAYLFIFNYEFYYKFSMWGIAQPGWVVIELQSHCGWLGYWRVKLKDMTSEWSSSDFSLWVCGDFLWTDIWVDDILRKWKSHCSVRVWSDWISADLHDVCHSCCCSSSCWQTVKPLHHVHGSVLKTMALSQPCSLSW